MQQKCDGLTIHGCPRSYFFKIEIIERGHNPRIINDYRIDSSLYLPVYLQTWASTSAWKLDRGNTTNEPTYEVSTELAPSEESYEILV